jgi:type IV secretion system protein VirD4
VLSLFFQQSIGLQTRELPERNPRLKHQVMMLLDECTALGRIPIIAESISYLPGYNVRVVLVIQTPAQLREVYGVHNAETMWKSLAVRIVFAPKDFGDAQEISNELGYTTVKVRTLSKPVFTLDGHGHRSRSQSVSEQRRALLLPQEVKELGTDEAIIFYEGLRPIRGRKIRYFKDRHFRRRLRAPPARPAPFWEPGNTALQQRVRSIRPGVSSEEAMGAAGDTAMTHTAAVEDVERIDTLEAEDFAIDFSRIKYPDHDGRMSAQEVQTLVSTFLDTVSR